MTRDDGQRRYCAADSNKLAAHLLADRQTSCQLSQSLLGLQFRDQCRKVPFTAHQLKDMQIVCTPLVT